MSLTVIVLVVMVIVGIVLVVLLARRQGPQATVMMHTEDQVDRGRLDEELGATMDTGVEVDGRLSGDAVPEPLGPPPVEGAQWDEAKGRWIHWDDTAGAWIPVPD